jgi:flotillin
VQVAVVEKRKQIEVQEQEVMRRERELDATVRKPAEAEQYRIQTLASAKKFQLEVEAEGQAAATRNIGVGEADANKARGLAQADVIQATGLAEAQATSKKAAAWEQYTQAAILQQLLDKLPQLASAIAQPLSKMDKIVIVNTGGDGHSGAGASRVTRDVADTMAQLPPIIEALTGISLMDLLKNLPAVRTAVAQPEPKPAEMAPQAVEVVPPAKENPPK